MREQGRAITKRQVVLPEGKAPNSGQHSYLHDGVVRDAASVSPKMLRLSGDTTAGHAERTCTSLSPYQTHTTHTGQLKACEELCARGCNWLIALTDVETASDVLVKACVSI